MQKYHIEKVYSSDKKKDGSPLVNSKGEPFTKYSVLVGEEWLELKGYGKADVKPGDIIEAELEEKRGTGQWSDRTFKALVLPKPDPMGKIAELESRITALELAVFEDKEIDTNDIPF